MLLCRKQIMIMSPYIQDDFAPIQDAPVVSKCATNTLAKIGEIHESYVTKVRIRSMISSILKGLATAPSMPLSIILYTNGARSVTYSTGIVRNNSPPLLVQPSYLRSQR